MSTADVLRSLLNDDQVVTEAIAVFKVAIDKGKTPFEAFRYAMTSVVARVDRLIPPPDRNGRSISHDERIALANSLMRHHIDPAVKANGDGAVLLVFDPSGNGLLTYISNCDRDDCRKMLRDLLRKWDAAALERSGN